MGKAAETGDDVAMLAGEGKEVIEDRALLVVVQVRECGERHHAALLAIEVLGVLQHQIAEHLPDRRQRACQAVRQAAIEQRLGSGVTGEGFGLAAMDHPGKLVEQDQQRQPAVGRLRPVVQPALQRLGGEPAEALAGFGILSLAVAEPQVVPLRGDLARRAALAEPPVQQRLPGRRRSGVRPDGDTR